MSLERWRSELEPEALEQCLRAALAVDPSPEFVPKVRTRIASEIQPRPWSIGLLLIIATVIIYLWSLLRH
jgi:hypothetical protein